MITLVVIILVICNLFALWAILDECCEYKHVVGNCCRERTIDWGIIFFGLEAGAGLAFLCVLYLP